MAQLINGSGNLLEIFTVDKTVTTAWTVDLANKILSVEGITGTTRNGLPSQQQEFTLDVSNLEMGETFQNFLDVYVPQTATDTKVKFESNKEQSLGGSSLGDTQKFFYTYYYAENDNKVRVLMGYGYLTGDSGSTTTSPDSAQTGNIQITALEVTNVDGVTATTLTAAPDTFEATRVTGVEQVLSKALKTQFGKLPSLAVA